MLQKSLSVYCSLILAGALSGCNLSAEDREKLESAQVDLEKLADEIVITYPATGTTITTDKVIVRADIPSDAGVSEVTLYVDGLAVSKDSDGAPWEITWQPYFWADNEPHVLFLKAQTNTGTEVRTAQQYSVTVSDSITASLWGSDSDINISENSDFIFNVTPIDGASSYDVEISSVDSSEIYTIADVDISVPSLSFGDYSVKYRGVKILEDGTAVVGGWSNNIDLNYGTYTKKYGGSGQEYIRDVSLSSDGDLLMLIHTNSSDINSALQSSDDWIVKQSADGSNVTDFILHHGGSARFFSVVELDGGDLLLVGTDWDSLKGVVSRVTSEGVVVWESIYSAESGSPRFDFTDVIVSGGNAYAVGRTWIACSSTCMKIGASSIHKISLSDGSVGDALSLSLPSDLAVTGSYTIEAVAGGLIAMASVTTNIAYPDAYAPNGTYLWELDFDGVIVASDDMRNDSSVNKVRQIRTDSNGDYLILAGTNNGTSDPSNLTLIDSESFSSTRKSLNFDYSPMYPDFSLGMVLSDKVCLIGKSFDQPLSVRMYTSDLFVRTDYFYDVGNFDTLAGGLCEDDFFNIVYSKDNDVFVRRFAF